MNVEDIAAIADRSTTRFRLETLPTYQVDQEADDFARWQRGDRTLLTPDTNEWLAHIRDTTAAGVHWARVRILDYPLTPYSRFELHGYQANQRAGDQIYIADRTWSTELGYLRDDFWLFDATPICMVYDDDGRFVRAEQPPDPGRYLGLWGIATRHSVPLDEFLTAYEPKLVA